MKKIMNVDFNNLELDKFTLQAKAMYGRLRNLYQNANTQPLKPDIVLPQALVELGSASEIVEVATEELYQLNHELRQTRDLAEAQRQRYLDLFEFAPDGYLVTDAQGKIEEANRAAARLLNISQQQIVGKLLINNIYVEERQRFRHFLINLSRSDKVRELVVRLQQRGGEVFDAAFTVAAVRNQHGSAVSLRWLVRNITQEKQAVSALFDYHCGDIAQNRVVYKHSKGEIIPLNLQEIWYVCRGWVKLCTICESGEEVMVGLAGEGMVFGSSMTSLQIYQATAMSDVEIVSIHTAELVASPMLSHILLPKINQRLRQTESFLAVSGRRRVQDRFYYLLQVLQQEVGEPVPEGIRLKVRLIHEDLASACCTTRVTITRLMGKLQKQEKICFDSKNHLILKDL
jgi:PAS domain S-box-containing protein